MSDKAVYRIAPATPGLLKIQSYCTTYVLILMTFGIHVYGRNQSGCEKAKNVGFLPFILWIFITIYICVALMKLTMCFKELEAHILIK